jgi:MFS family permease
VELDSAVGRARASLAGALGAVIGPRTPFERLLATQVLMLAGSAMVAIAMAGSFFFDISPHAARDHVLLGLTITFAPFVVIAPAIGPLLDAMDGMRRAMVLVASLGSLVLSVFMAQDLKNLLIFPESFGLLVMSKIYVVSKQALVPHVVGPDKGGEVFMKANATLNFYGAVAGFAGSAVGIAIWKLPFLGSPWVLRADAVVFLLAFLHAWRLPHPSRTRHLREGVAGPHQGEVPTDPMGVPAIAVSPLEDPEALRSSRQIYAPGIGGGQDRHRHYDEPPLVRHRALRNRVIRQHMAGIFAAASAVAVLRASTGFMEFLLIFTLRRQHYSLVWFGVVMTGLTLGSVAANLVAPRLRARLAEESIVSASLLAVAVAAAATASTGGMLTEAMLMAVTALSAGVAKVAFDTLVQSGMPKERRGTAFARFETRFQLVWVLGAVIPVAVAFPVSWGDVALACASALAAAAYLYRWQSVRRHAARRRAAPAVHS